MYSDSVESWVPGRGHSYRGLVECRPSADRWGGGHGGGAGGHRGAMLDLRALDPSQEHPHHKHLVFRAVQTGEDQSYAICTTNNERSFSLVQV